MKYTKTLIVIALFIAAPAFGAPNPTEYETLAPIGDIIGTTFDTTNFSLYLNNMFKLGIAVAGALAVIQIIIGGMKYVTSATMGQKGDGKAKIEAAIMGLVVVLGAYALLNTIDSRLLRTDVLNKYNPAATVPLSVASPCPTVPPAKKARLNIENNMAGVLLSVSKTTDINNVLYPQSINPASDPSIFELEPCPTTVEVTTSTGGSNINNTVTTNASGSVTANGKKILKSAQDMIGKNTCNLSDGTNGRLACATSVNAIVQDATGQPINDSPSTATMNKSLQSSGRFSLVTGGISQSLPGDIIISPTELDNVSNHGHVGIVETAGGESIISNSSKLGSVQRNFTAKKWIEKYTNKKGLELNIYRAN